MRYEGTIQVMGFINVIIEGPNLTQKQAENLIKSNPERYKSGYLQSMNFEAFESFEKIDEGEEDDT
jgi:hypothetical protein